ncbi:MAG: alpha/beta hydrolase [Actinomycetota bacterium]
MDDLEDDLLASTVSGTVTAAVDGTCVEVAYLRRPGSGQTLVCLHGFGSTKEDYADLALHPAFRGRDLVLLDAPGFGASRVDRPDRLSIPFLVDVVAAVCDDLGIERFHLSGHSMGGLTALLFCRVHRDRVVSFVDIEGNLAPEDCFLSRQILDHPAESPDAFLDGFIQRVGERSEYASRLYASTIRAKVRPTSVEPIFVSMVDLSDNHQLMRIMADLPMPRLFIHGEQNRHLSYLGHLPAIGVEVAEIPFAGHFPMYSNPTALWSVIDTFLTDVEAAS